jgi:hypothetical protein
MEKRQVMRTTRRQVLLHGAVNAAPGIWWASRYARRCRVCASRSALYGHFRFMTPPPQQTASYKLCNWGATSPAVRNEAAALAGLDAVIHKASLRQVSAAATLLAKLMEGLMPGADLLQEVTGSAIIDTVEAAADVY